MKRNQPPTIFALCPTLCLVAVLAACGGRQTEPSGAGSAPTVGAPSEPVWALDLVRTLPGAQADYVRSIEANWASARAIARQRGAVLSYRAFVAAPDSARGWDVLLMTEYADSAAHANREEIFREIFASPEFVRLEPARPSAEMREFLAGDVVLREFVSGGGP